MMKYWNKQGREITRDEWLDLWGDKNYRQIAKDKISEIEISTVWVGGPSNSPKGIFETMTFCKKTHDSCPFDQWQERADTEYEAMAQHCRLIDLLSLWH